MSIYEKHRTIELLWNKMWSDKIHLVCLRYQCQDVCGNGFTMDWFNLLEYDKGKRTLQLGRQNFWKLRHHRSQNNGDIIRHLPVLLNFKNDKET